LSFSTCQSCKDQKVALELRHTYDSLTRLRDVFVPLCAQLFACHPCVSLMDAFAEVCNEETRLQDAGLLWVSSVLVAHSSGARPTAIVPLVSSICPVSCSWCEYWSSLWSLWSGWICGGLLLQEEESSEGSDSPFFTRYWSSASSETHELLMLLHHLATPTLSGVVGFVTQSSALTGSATASQSSPLGPPSTPSPGSYPWYLNSGASFHMTPHSAHLSSLHLFTTIALFIFSMDPLFLLLDRALFPLALFMSVMFLLLLL
jgi:hypothetical protein